MHRRNNRVSDACARTRSEVIRARLVGRRIACVIAGNARAILAELEAQAARRGRVS